MEERDQADRDDCAGTLPGENATGLFSAAHAKRLKPAEDAPPGPFQMPVWPALLRSRERLGRQLSLVDSHVDATVVGGVEIAAIADELLDGVGRQAPALTG